MGLQVLCRVPAILKQIVSAYFSLLSLSFIDGIMNSWRHQLLRMIDMNYFNVNFLNSLIQQKLVVTLTLNLVKGSKVKSIQAAQHNGHVRKLIVDVLY